MTRQIVLPGHVFVHGDNCDNSCDSRFFSPVPIAYLRAKPLYVYRSTVVGRTGLRLDSPAP